MLAASPLDPLYNAIGYVLAFFYLPLHSLGLAIILLTIVVMLVQFPLIAKQTRSMIQMQRVQPEIKKIQQKYKDDRQKQNEELLKFYQENKINPIAGCLPIIVTLPIGIAVFRTFSQGVQRHIPQSGTFSGLYDAICTKGIIAAGHLQAAAHQPKPVTVKTNLQACSYALDHYPQGKTPPVFRFLGMNLNWSAHEVQSQLSGQYLHWVPYFLLIGLVIFTGWYQVRQTQSRQQRQGGPQPNSQMQAITKIMPLFFGVITYGLNAATTMYFLISNAWRIGQQHFVLNKFYEEDAAKGAAKASAPKVEDVEPEPQGNGGPARKGPAKPTKPAKPTSGSGGATGRSGGASSNGGGSRSTSGAARRKRKRKR